jgi:hypothetical protein
METRSAANAASMQASMSAAGATFLAAQAQIAAKDVEAANMASMMGMASMSADVEAEAKSTGTLCTDARFSTLALAQEHATACGCDPAEAHAMDAAFMVGHACIGTTGGDAQATVIGKGKRKGGNIKGKGNGRGGKGKNGKGKNKKTKLEQLAALGSA